MGEARLSRAAGTAGGVANRCPAHGLAAKAEPVMPFRFRRRPSARKHSQAISTPDSAVNSTFGSSASRGVGGHATARRAACAWWESMAAGRPIPASAGRRPMTPGEPAARSARCGMPTPALSDIHLPGAYWKTAETYDPIRFHLPVGGEVMSVSSPSSMNFHSAAGLLREDRLQNGARTPVELFAVPQIAIPSRSL